MQRGARHKRHTSLVAIPNRLIERQNRKRMGWSFQKKEGHMPFLALYFGTTFRAASHVASSAYDTARRRNLLLGGRKRQVSLVFPFRERGISTCRRMTRRCHQIPGRVGPSVCPSCHCSLGMHSCACLAASVCKHVCHSKITQTNLNLNISERVSRVL